MSADASDLSLVRRVQRGDKGAFDALVLKYQHKLVKLVMRYVRNPAEAEDIRPGSLHQGLSSSAAVSRRQRFLHLAVSHRYQHRQERRGLP